MNKRKIMVLFMSLTIAMTFSFMGMESVFATDNAGTLTDTVTAEKTTVMPNFEKAKTSKKNAIGPITMTAAKTAYDIDFGESYQSQEVSFKIKATKTGVLRFYYDGGYGAKPKIYSASGKALATQYPYSIYADSSSVYGQYAPFGVKKGKTYIIKLSDYGKRDYTLNRYVGYAAYDIKAYSGSYGKSKKKSKKLKANKTYKGYGEAGKKSVRYYKFTKKSKNAKIIVTGETSKSIKVTVTAKGFSTYSRTLSPLYNGDKLTIKASQSKKRKVTYYVKVVVPKGSSGGYTIKCK